jgi:hypothetical protein
MQGDDTMQEPPFMMEKLEDFVPADRPLRPIRLLANTAAGAAERPVQPDVPG